MHTLAYLDPGVGSILFQTLVAGALGMLLTLKSIRAKLSVWFSSMFRREPPNKPDDQTP